MSASSFCVSCSRDFTSTCRSFGTVGRAEENRNIYGGWQIALLHALADFIADWLADWLAVFKHLWLIAWLTSWLADWLAGGQAG